MKEEFENEYIRFWKDNGILYGKYKEDVVIDIDVAKKIASDRVKFCDGKYYPQIAYISGIKKVSKEARDFFSDNEGVQFMTAMALLTESPLGSIIGNFFNTLSKPKVPTKLFTSEEEAIKWLKHIGEELKK